MSTLDHPWPAPLLYQSEDILVFNKPSGSALLKDRSGAADLWSALKEIEKPYLVHRLDKGTSGVLVVARRPSSQRALTQLFNQRRISKFYLAWVAGCFPQNTTYQIELPLCRGRKSRYRVAAPRESICRHDKRFHVDADRPGVDAYTRVRCLTQASGRSLLLLKPLTGRTHQLRVHLSWIGFPIVGDHLYGRPDTPEQRADRLMLHCQRLVIPGWGSFATGREPLFSSAP